MSSPEEPSYVDCALADVLQLERLIEALKAREHTLTLQEGRTAQLEAAFRSSAQQHETQLAQLAQLASKNKNLAKECNAALEHNLELQNAVNQSQVCVGLNEHSDGDSASRFLHCRLTDPL